MGLDMYACTTINPPRKPVDSTVGQHAELHYWRKHPNLHGWMEAIYRAKGGEDENFNCVNLLLTAEDLDHLEADIRAGNLPENRGHGYSTETWSDKDSGRRCTSSLNSQEIRIQPCAVR